jgi:hypothetical protein
VKLRRGALDVGAALLVAGGALAQSPPIASQDARAVVFVGRGCNRCHGIWALGVKSKSDIAPDLTFAYADVVNRFGIPLEAFFNNPGAVMHVMLAPHFNWPVADRDSIASVLEAIFKEHEAQYQPPLRTDTTVPK